MKYCLPEQRRNEKQGTVFLAPKSLLSFFLSLWDVLHEHTASEFLSGVLLLFSCPLHSFSHSHLHYHKQVISFWDTASWWREAVTAEFQGVFCTIRNKWTMLDVPVIHIGPHVSLLWHPTLLGLLLFSISPFCQQNNITKPFFHQNRVTFSTDLDYGSVSGRLILLIKILCIQLREGRRGKGDRVPCPPWLKWSPKYRKPSYKFNVKHKIPIRKAVLGNNKWKTKYPHHSTSSMS